ncbi:glucans biosynthesis glucosyltransferase MdoH [Yoonia sp. GPGPB17]|uniref:glucans biosynthesis glucosyltransferase MdoH n=1 Tax=Yoonia sp. GPGPB17 TaxID=3026147 RepID=UPI0030C2EDC5
MARSDCAGLRDRRGGICAVCQSNRCAVGPDRGGLCLSAVVEWSALTVVVAVLIMVNGLWISGGAATAVLGLFAPAVPQSVPPQHWVPKGKTAVLIALCGEAPGPLAAYLNSFARGLGAVGLGREATVFVLSDTSGTSQIAAEEAALANLIAQGRIVYRRRTENINRKPGNIADWLNTHGSDYEYMVVKDADSRMTPDSIKQLTWQLETRPGTGLLQAAIALIPGRTRFGRHQRISSRLLGRAFGRGFAAWSGKAGNYWGHNAIMRVAAFRSAARLPRLSGRAPFGGDLLSHDFVEAAWMRRAGWDIELAPDMRGSAEDAPQSLQEFFRRDRRWCQGNLQHLRLLASPGLHPVSRMHLVTGAFSYLSAPIWLLLLLLLSLGAISVSNYASIALVAVVLLMPKLCALVDLLPRARTIWRRRVILRAWLSELALSTLVGPLISLRHATSVGSILIGQDCGWKSGRKPLVILPAGWSEVAVGLVALALALSSPNTNALWLAPVIAPLLIAPLLMLLLNGKPA